MAVLALAGAAYAAVSWDAIRSAPDQADLHLAQQESSSGQAAAVIFTPMSETQIEQDAMRSALAFGGPTDLGAFSTGSPEGLILADRFRAQAAALQAPSTAKAPIVVAEAPSAPAEIPTPTANPFRLQSPAPAIVARRERPVAARPPVIASKAANPPREEGLLQTLFGRSEPKAQTALAYAPVEAESLKGWPAAAPSRRSVVDDKTAIYDISTKTVTLPGGQRLEAHSGLGEFLDDPSSLRMKSRGVTPPNVYTLRLREALFHGVRALRLVPLNEGRMFGRDGILAHSFMLGPRGDSNGCVSFRDYDAFLSAFLRGEVTRIVVAENASSVLALAGTNR